MVTIRDVANAAGVSIATVSRSLNGRSRVSETTRSRVLDIAEQLDYRPSHAARGLVTGRLGTIGVLLPDVTNLFYTPILAGIEQAAQAQNLGVLLADSREDAASERALARRMRELVDGVVLVASRLSDAELLDVAESRPTVLANRIVDGLDGIALDAGIGMAQVLARLAADGHRTVLYLPGPPASWSGARKVQALRHAAAEHGVELLEHDPIAPSFQAGRNVAASVLARQINAVIAYDDLIAWGLLSALEEAGVDVPGQMSVAGCDDALLPGMARPALTTVKADLDAIGATAAELLLARIAAPASAPMASVLPSQAVFRASTGPVPA